VRKQKWVLVQQKNDNQKGLERWLGAVAWSGLQIGLLDDAVSLNPIKMGWR